MSKKIYVASSWRNDLQPDIVRQLREACHEVYDFRNPESSSIGVIKDAPPGGFHWSEIDPEWQSWDSARFREGLEDPIAEIGFAKDYIAMKWCDACVLVMPCGRSAHLELGWAAGAGKQSIILLPEGADAEPELMYLLADHICVSMEEVLVALSTVTLNPTTVVVNLGLALCPDCGPEHVLDNVGQGEIHNGAWCENCGWEGTCGDLVK